MRKSIPPSSTDIIVTKPKDPQTLVCIHSVIERVLVNGHEFEQALVEKEAQNPTFAFLADHKVSLCVQLDVPVSPFCT